ncbi:hypothetical protein VTH06DRAFT_4406 [Thermothelomyces fergusii]
MPVFSEPLRRRESSLHSTWYENDPDSPQERTGSSVFTARTSISDPHRPVMETESDGDGDVSKEKRANDWRGILSIPVEVFSLDDGCATRTRPRTPGNQAYPEKVRIANIPPIATSPEHTSSLPWSRQSTDSTRAASDPELPSVRRTSERRENLSSNGHVLQAPCGSMPLIEMASGQTVIDASEPPPPIAFASRSQAVNYSHARPLSAIAADATDQDEMPRSSKEHGSGASHSLYPKRAGPGHSAAARGHRVFAGVDILLP